LTQQTLLTSWFNGKPESDRILIWQLAGKRSFWYPSVEAIPAEESWSGDTYFGVGTAGADSATEYGAHHRCPADRITGIGGLWLDIDIASPAHKKGNLPPNEAEAMRLLTAAFPALSPSYIIHSGHGLQAYWLFDKWLPINTDESSAEAKATGFARAVVQDLLLAFNTHWRSHCAAEGFDADSVCDLARLMRLPGTTNCKLPGEPAGVTGLVSNPELKYSFKEFAARFSAPTQSAEPKPKKGAQRKATPIKDKPRTINKDKFVALCEADQRVLRTWELDRPELQSKSASELTISLGRLAHNAGWTDQEVYDLMFHFRARHHFDPKPHALKLTLQKILATPSGFSDTEDEAKELEAIENSATFAELGEVIGVEIDKLTRYNTTPPAYIMLIKGEPVCLGTIEGLTELKKFRNTVAAATGILPNKFKADDWDKIVRKLLALQDHDFAGAEATEGGQCIEWIQAFLNDAQIHANRVDGIAAGQPFFENNLVHLSGTSLRSWVAIHLQDRIDSRRLCLVLRSIGAEPISIGNRNVWKIPATVWERK